MGQRPLMHGRMWSGCNTSQGSGMASRNGMASRALTSARRGVSVVTIGLSIFLASVPLGITGLCDPKPARGNAVLTAAILAIPIGLLAAAM